MFIGRERELKKLNELYKVKGFQFPVIYGRRRVGKTALINEFVKNKKVIFITGIESNAKQNLENFSRAILSSESNVPDAAVFQSFKAALEYVFQLAKKERLILVIDDYPYIAKAFAGLSSTLQALIEKNKESSKLFLILCGSSMSFMEKHLLANKAPLYSRKTAQLEVLPFDFFESRNCLKRFSRENMAVIYGAVGGIPKYLLQMNDRLPLDENIKHCFLDASSPLFEEPINLLKQEVREPATYNAILAAVAAGNSKLTEISTKAGIETGACAMQIKNLISLGIVKKEMPLAGKTNRKTIYQIEDNLFRFWYRFVPDNIAAISRGMADDVYEKISTMINDYMDTAFEDICKQYLWKQREQGRVDVKFTDLGRWWGNGAGNRREAGIDIMGVDGKGGALFCECKWTNEKVDVSVLEALMERSELFRNKKVRFYLFAKRGFTKKCVEKARTAGNVKLVAFSEMCHK